MFLRRDRSTTLRKGSISVAPQSLSSPPALILRTSSSGRSPSAPVLAPFFAIYIDAPIGRSRSAPGRRRLQPPQQSPPTARSRRCTSALARSRPHSPNVEFGLLPRRARAVHRRRSLVPRPHSPNVEFGPLSLAPFFAIYIDAPIGRSRSAPGRRRLQPPQQSPPTGRFLAARSAGAQRQGL
jgi:hypothetical protein